MELIFGEKYRVERIYKKSYSFKRGEKFVSNGYTIDARNPFTGIYIGKRVISEGFNSEGVFIFENSITVYLFAKNKKQLCYVPIDNVSVKPLN